MARPVSSSRPLGSSTTTLTLENPSQQRPQQQQTLVLRLSRPQSRKKVTWKEGTVDNEFLQRKSSKKCCIFHKEKPFDEDDSDDEDGHSHDHNHESSQSDGSSGCCSKNNEASTSSCCP
ncbi:hypothetical protein GIB67_031608 [Kingdonia uniflora]|uniref:Uncharacterized protein n=1 Tax=Kingdonia uniflora TaxID=39325 RepID=A0A7J7LYE0_9MAGN|nr:hypothetical protein GIB67_031608 [Kingdonia uniflora]